MMSGMDAGSLGLPGGRVFVVSGPSGAGKSSLCKELLETVPNLKGSVSYTTRPPRQGEVEGRDYHFVDTRTFQRLVEEGAFLEYSEVHGYLYGTLEREVRDRLQVGDLLLEVDCKGAANIKQHMKEACLVFVMPPSVEDLIARIRYRGPISEEDLLRRMETARQEIQSLELYDYLVINDRFSDALECIRAIIIAGRCSAKDQIPRWKSKWLEECAALSSSEGSLLRRAP